MKNKVVLNTSIIDKLEDISYDIKYNLNINALLAESLDFDNINSYKVIDDEDINELLKIRKRIKQLTYKLKNKI